MEKDFIEGIYNYCDRYCERCPFAARCEVRAESLAQGQGGEWVINVQEKLQDLLNLLESYLEENGISVTDAAEDAAAASEFSFEELAQQIDEMAGQYAALVEMFFKNNEAFFQEKSKEREQSIELNVPINIESIFELNESLLTISWFTHFIGTKAYRAVVGLSLEDDEDFLQSDANGSAKVCIIGIDQSMVAWEMTRRAYPEKTDEILEILVQLRRVRKELVVLFPHWEQFIRPGFDTEPAGFAVFHSN